MASKMLSAAALRLAAQQERIEELESGVALLTDPQAVHLNMLRGGIAKLTPAQIGHLYRGYEAREVLAEVSRQNPEASKAQTKSLVEALEAAGSLLESYGDDAEVDDREFVKVRQQVRSALSAISKERTSDDR